MHRIDDQMPDCGTGSDKCANVRDSLPPSYLRIRGDYADGGKTLKPARYRQAVLRLTTNKVAQSRHLTLYKVGIIRAGLSELNFANWLLVQSYDKLYKRSDAFSKMSALGHKRTFSEVCEMSALPS
jgi:hypothetical protein